MLKEIRKETSRYLYLTFREFEQMILAANLILLDHFTKLGTFLSKKRPFHHSLRLSLSDDDHLSGDGYLSFFSDDCMSLSDSDPMSLFGDDDNPLLSLEPSGSSVWCLSGRILGSEVCRVHTQVSPSSLTDPV